MRLWAGLFFAGVGLNILIGLGFWPAVLSGHLNDPDSYMLLERIREGVAHGHLTNMVARDESGAGVLVHWSRLLDALIWAMALPFVPFLGWTRALLTAGIIFGPLTVGLLSISLAAIAEPFVARRFLWLLPVSVALLPSLSNYATPGVVTHHMLLLVLVATTTALVIRASTGEVGIGFLAGISGGFAIWLTPETMPFVLMAFGGLLICWLERPVGATVVACGAGFFDVLGIAFFIDPPVGGYGVVEIDRLSVVFMGLGIAVLLAGTAVWLLEKRKVQHRHAKGLAVGAVLLVAWLVCFPSVLRGPYGLMDAAGVKLMFSVVQEMKGASFDARSFAFLWPGFLALGFVVFECAQTRSPRWVYVLVCMIVMLGLGIKFIRFAPISSAAAAVLGAIALQRISAGLSARESRAALARISLLVLLLGVPFLPAVAASHAKKAAAAKPGTACDLTSAVQALGMAKGKIVLADVNLTPELLWRTDVLTVGSLYHHGVAGFLRLFAAWRSPVGDSEPQAVTATGANYILFCTSGGRTDLVAGLPKTTLWDALLQNQPPDWLGPPVKIPNTGWEIFPVKQ